MQKKGRKSFLKHTQSTFLSIDMFGSPVNLEIEGNSTLRTYLGATISLLILLQILTYTFIKGNILINRSDTNHQVTVETGGIQISDVFHQHQTQFNLALGVQDKSWQ